MKRIIAIMLCALMLCCALAFTSCDYQASIDSVRANMMDSAKSALDPFFNKAESSTSGSQTEQIDTEAQI